MKPRVFIGSSSEGLNVAESLNLRLAKECETVPWQAGTFGISETYIGSLEKALSTVEFAVLVVTPDDTREKRGEEGKIPRDNVIFELGLFMGKLGRDRTFIVCDPTTIQLPSDLLGISTAEYNSKRSDNDLASAMIPAATQILQAIRRAPRLAAAASDHADSNVVADTEALYNAIVPWTASSDDEIVIRTSNTVWAWQLMPTIINWRLNGVRVLAYAPRVSAPPLVARGEIARRKLLADLGVVFQEIDQAGPSGFFLRSAYPDDNIAIVVNERSREGSNFARRYQGTADAPAVEALLAALPMASTDKANVDFVPKLVPQDPMEVVTLLRKGVKQYYGGTVDISVTTVATKDLLLMSPYARAYKYAQVRRLLDWYGTTACPAFSALAIGLRSGEKTIVTPPVVEIWPDGPVVMEGTTRATYCAKNNVDEYHCVAVKGVQEALPGSPVKIDAVTISERSLSQGQRTEDYREQLYRRIERAIHPY